MGNEAAKGTRSAGAVVLVITLVTQLLTSMGSLAFSMTSVGGSMQAAARRLAWLRAYSSGANHVSSTSADKDTLSVRSLPDELSEGIRFEGVTFRYGEGGPEVLSGLNLVLPAGATVAVVGENGAGKSTLVKLLLRMYPPTERRILVDGVDLESVSAEKWRSRTSATFQDFARYEFSLQESAGVGFLEELDNDEAALAALGQAGGADLVESLPDGLESLLESQLGESAELSGGQWQKVALGRAMMRKAPLILVLDEPTAALDALAEAALFDRYASFARTASRAAGGITVLISHRYSTVRTTDPILVLRDGAVYGSGSHRELMGLGGVYVDLYRTQAAAYR